MPFKTLASGGGFSANLQLPVPDPIATKYAIKWFGEGNVNLITQRYHRAQVTIDRLRDDVFEFSRTYHPRIVDPSYDAIYMSVLKEFQPKEPIIPWTNGHVFTSNRAPRSSAAGFPYIGMSKGEVFDNPSLCKDMISKWRAVGAGYPIKFPDTQVFFRAQVCDPTKHKIRATWGYPVSVFAEEARFLYPYLDWLKERTDMYPLAYGLEMANGGMQYINNMANLVTSPYHLMIDWSKFDKTIPPWLIRDAFSIFFHAFDLSHVCDSEGIIWEVSEEETKRRISKLIKYFINTPFQMSTGERFMKDGGVPSGSAFTNIIDSIVNAIATRYCIYHTLGGMWVSDMYLGDDGYVVLRSPLSIDALAEFAMQQFGMEINKEKSYITTNPINIKFLGFNNFSGYPARGQDFLIASFIFPERFYGNPDPGYSAVRALGQLWSTLNPKDAIVWLRIIEDLQDDFSFKVEEYLSTLERRKFFKFLLTLGFSLDDLGVPEVIHGIIPAVMPKNDCKRIPVICSYHMESLYQELQTISVWIPP